MAKSNFIHFACFKVGTALIDDYIGKIVDEGNSMPDRVITNTMQALAYA